MSFTRAHAPAGLVLLTPQPRPEYDMGGEIGARCGGVDIQIPPETNSSDHGTLGSGKVEPCMNLTRCLDTAERRE